ncbi:acyl-CoA thioesterase [Abyssalbus ytuae]|uniref:Thioesterase family protein n=1 Tax=Abyssalbus ytuae TaxID=2926907 RepID=A0A9E7D3R0_9FLAO|nr:thioesterase family protein [Abyssalbus ytuae]UOB18114.1 thioesterase family protein [Abyssalbus ytuae]
MYKKKYKVRGEDVNDFMIMKNTAYLFYASHIRKTFLLEKGFSNFKLNKLKIGLLEESENIQYKKQLIFTQSFFVDFKVTKVRDLEKVMTTENNFYDEKKEICATVYSDIAWYDLGNRRKIFPPKYLAMCFNDLNNNILMQSL